MSPPASSVQKKMTEFAASYFRRRRVFRILLLITILALWAYVEISDLFPITARDLNFQSVQEISNTVKQDNYSFAVLGDTKNSPIFDDLIKQINKDKKLGFAIIGGDLVQFPSTETYRNFLKQRSLLHIPTLVLPGNHDVAFQNDYFYHRIFGRFYYSFALGSSQFILLNDSNEKDLDQQQYAWLEQQLVKGQKYQNRFVFMHVPLWDPRDSESGDFKFAHSLKNSDFARKLEALFKKYKVTILFESHVHGYYDIPQPGLHRILSGGGGAALAGADPKHSFYHYVRVNVSKDGVKTDVVKLKNYGTGKKFKLYAQKAWIYIVTFARLYALYITMALFIAVLLIDGVFEYLHRKRSETNTTKP